MIESPDPKESLRQLRARIRVPNELAEQPDPESKKEQIFLANAKKKVEIESDWEDLHARKKYAGYAFGLVTGWLVFIAATVLLQGFRVFGFDLDYKIILALIGGTTTSTVGIFLVVARYFFYRQQSSRRSE